MNSEQSKFWQKIRSFELDNAASDLTFTDRLARENAWSHEFAVRSIEEYKKFMFLLCIEGESLTPSDEVDQVWHLHLLYTESYWDTFCSNILSKKVHHGPTKGGEAEYNKYRELYQKTLLAYFRAFNQHPPRDIWPDPETRFRETRFQRINRDEHWIIPKNLFRNK
jgi:hypothetical protein